MVNRSLSDSLLNQLQTAVLVLNEQLLIIEANSAAEELAEMSRKQLLTSSFLQLFNQSEFSPQVLDISFTTGKSYYQRDVETILLSGRKTIVDIAINRFKHQNQNVLLMEISQTIGSAIFTVKQKELGQHQQTRHLLNELAHEIRNPLGGLRGAAQLLAEEIESTQKPFTDIIIREADRLGELVERVLGTGKPEMKSTFNIHEVIEEVFLLMTMDHPENIKIVRDYDPSLPRYTGFRQSLYQAILNLIRNAIQAIQSIASNSNECFRVCIATRVEHAILIGDNYFPMALRIMISDNGPGIPAAIKEQLFMPMVSGREQGSGLGLAIAREAIEQHGGSLQWLENEAETVFCIHLPHL